MGKMKQVGQRRAFCNFLGLKINLKFQQKNCKKNNCATSIFVLKTLKQAYLLLENKFYDILF